MKKIYLFIFLMNGLNQLATSQSNCPTIPANTDFGLCAMALGIANVEDQGCVMLSGCGYTSTDGIDYTEYFFDTQDQCEAACLDACPEIPLSADFGECDMALGVAMLEGGQCTFLSGCGYTANDGVDYSSYFFDSMEECETACGDDCIDPSLIDPNAICIMIWAPVCGCDNVTYSNDCVATTQGGVTSFTDGECLVNVDEIESEIISVFPNPTTNFIQFNVPQGLNLQTIHVFSIDGKNALSLPYNKQVDVSNLAAGNYVVRATASNSSLVFETRFTKK